MYFVFVCVCSSYCCWIITTPHFLTWNNYFNMLTNFMDQELQKVTMGMACLCSVVSGVSAQKSWNLGWLNSYSPESLEGVSIHRPSDRCCCQPDQTWFCLPQHFFRASPHILCFLTTWLLQGSWTSYTVTQDKAELHDLLWSSFTSHIEWPLLHLLGGK